MNDHSDKPTTTSRSWFRRRHEIESDSVDIDQEDNHAWWAARDEVSPAASTRRMQERLASAPSPAQAAATAAFAPASVGDPPPTAPASGTSTPPHEASRGWDSDSVYEWAARPSDLRGVADDEPDSAELPWTVLGLDPDAPWDEVVRRHRLLAKHLHPDLHATIEAEVRKEIEARMAQINAAFADLESLYRMRKGA